MKINWRDIRWARNSYAALYAACEGAGIILESVDRPEDDITLYSLNSVDEPELRDEIRDAPCITIAGGPHASACYRQVAEYADYVVVGEGEYTLPALLSYIEAGETGPLPPGVSTRDTYTPPDTSVWLPAYCPFTKVRGFIEISRGCPFGCAYCQTPQLFGRQMRHRTIDQIVESAKVFRDVRFVTPNALAYGSDGRHLRLDRVDNLLKSLHDHRVFFGTFPSEVRPECVSTASLDIITRYCANRKLHFGAQSGSEAVLKRLHRGHTVDDVIKAVELCHDYDVMPVVDVIVCLPFETPEDQMQTVDLIRWVTRFGKVHAHYFTPLPGTPLSGTTPVTILPEVQKALGSLALNGRVTGSWIDARTRFFRED